MRWRNIVRNVVRLSVPCLLLAGISGMALSKARGPHGTDPWSADSPASSEFDGLSRSRTNDGVTGPRASSDGEGRQRGQELLLPAAEDLRAELATLDQARGRLLATAAAADENGLGAAVEQYRRQLAIVKTAVAKLRLKVAPGEFDRYVSRVVRKRGIEASRADTLLETALGISPARMHP